jgi:hypothetical protein
MSDLKNEFLSEIEKSIRIRQTCQLRYKIVQLVLTTIVTSCGFLTAATSQVGDKVGWMSSPKLLLIVGLLSAACAIVNQVANPGEKYSYHRNCKKALQKIRGEVKYRGVSVSEAERLRALADANPEAIIGKLETLPSLEMKNSQ